MLEILYGNCEDDRYKICYFNCLLRMLFFKNLCFRFFFFFFSGVVSVLDFELVVYGLVFYFLEVVFLFLEVFYYDFYFLDQVVYGNEIDEIDYIVKVVIVSLLLIKVICFRQECQYIKCIDVCVKSSMFLNKFIFMGFFFLFICIYILQMFFEIVGLLLYKLNYMKNIVNVMIVIVLILNMLNLVSSESV